MNLDWKKIGLIALFVGAVFLFGFFIYYFFFKPLFVPTDQPLNINQNTNGQLPTTININGKLYVVNTNGLPSANGNTNQISLEPVVETKISESAQGGKTKVTQLTNSTSLFATATAGQQMIYYNQRDGKFYTVSADGTIKEYSNKVFNNVSNTTWSNNKKQAILEYPDGSNIVYDFENNKQSTLPQHWYDFSFSPTDQNIAFKSNALDPENRFLVAAKLDGSQPAILENIGDQGNKFNVNWSPNNQMVATFTKSKDFERTDVYFIGLNKENFKLMTVDGRDFRGQWSTTGDKMVYSVYNSDNGYKPQLWVADTSSENIGGNRRSLGIETWADKCTFSSNNKVYCAVPISLPFGAGMDDASATNIADQIYEIDLATGSKSLIATPESDHTISNLMVDENSQYLFFTDSNNNNLYRINL